MRRIALTWTLMITVFTAGCAAEATTEPDSQGAAISARAATPIALSGSFRPGGTVEAIGRLTVDVIDTRMPDADVRLEEARKEGATCEPPVADTYRCTKMHPASDVPSSSLEAIATQNHGVFARFGQVTGGPSLVSEADSLVEWQIGQTGSTALGAFSGYRYLELSGDIVKIVLPGEHDSLELIVKDADHVGKWDSHVVTESRWRWHEDMAVVVLEH